jgi:CheY-like chemotaxis protein
MEAVGRLAGRVTHEFNNLLTVISGYNDLLLCDLAEGEPSRRKALEVRKACDRGVHLTRQLLAISRGQLDAPSLAELETEVRAMELLANEVPPCTVLLAVSDPQVREFGRRILEGVGCPVLEARDGAEACAIAADAGVAMDVLVADLTSVGESGSELRRLLSAERPTLRTLLLIRQGASPGEFKEATALEAELLMMPFQADELVAKVRALTSGRSAMGQDPG